MNQQKTNQQGTTQHMVPLRFLFRYVQGSDKILLVVGTFSAFINGATMPVLAVVMGEILGQFDPNNTSPQLIEDMKELFFIILYISMAQYLFAYLFTAFWCHLSENIAFTLRGKYLEALLKQEIGFFEKQDVQSLPSLVGEYFITIQTSLGESLSNIIMTFGTIVSGLTIAFVQGPIFALICLAYYPIVMAMGVLFGKHARNSSIQSINQLKFLGGAAEETLSSIKVVTSFNQEQREAEKFNRIVSETRSLAIKYAQAIAMVYGVMSTFMFSFFAYAFWIGSVAISQDWNNPGSEDKYSAQSIFTIQLGILFSLLNLNSLGPNFSALLKSLVIGKKIFDVIDRVPEIQDEPSKALVEYALDHSIEFKNVSFKYPTNRCATLNDINNEETTEENWIFKDASFTIKQGESTAIVGPSGAGKSTVVQLIERFYSIQQGEIRFDETNINDISLKALRESIGYVSQEPALILGTIKQNIMFSKSDATDEEIREALTKASALFAYEKDPSLGTYVGSSSITNLSGGQKQRIAIARALVKKPKILILDEATSALDQQSEKEVQNAIEKIEQNGEGMTIIIIAHRIQTIESAQNIIYLKNQNTQLVAKKGTPEYDEIMRVVKQEKEAFEVDSYQDIELNQIEEDIEIQDQENETLPKIKHQALPLLPDSEFIRHYTDPEFKKDMLKIQDQEDLGMQETIPEQLEGQQMRKVSLREIMKFYKPMPIVVLSFIISLISGFCFPLFGFVLPKTLFVLFYPDSPTYVEDVRFWCGLFLFQSVTYGITNGLQKICFKIVGENLISDIRTLLFKEIIYKDISWFDKKESAPGVLTNILSEDISLLTGLTTETFAIYLQGYSGMVIGMGLAFWYSWKSALITLGFSPLMTIGGVLRAKVQAKEQAALKNDPTGQATQQKLSNALLSDLILNFKTVIGFGPNNLNFIVEQYKGLLEPSRIKGIREAHIGGLFNGYANAIKFVFQGFIFYIATVLVVNHGEDVENAYVSVFLLLIAALGCGMQIQLAPSTDKARVAANKIFAMIEKQSAIDVRKEQGKQVFENGEIEFRDVCFSYPSKKSKLVLTNINMIFPQNKKIALVGHSGCGKSTITNLLLRMYDINSGSITINGVDIREMDLNSLRREVSIVMQEPQLFNASIKDNILYGNQDATDEQVREAAKLANALQFIEEDEDDVYDFSSQSQQQKTEERYQKVLLESPRLASLEKVFQVYEKYKIASYCLKEALCCVLEKESTLPTQLQDELSQPGSMANLANQLIDYFFQGKKSINLVMDLEWLKEMLVLEQFIANSSVNECYKKLVSFDILYCHKFAIDEEILKQWTDLIAINEVGDQILSEQEALALLHKFVREGEQKILNQWQDKKEGYRIKDETGPAGQLHPGFNRLCGLKGSFLSGGQKQRVAIARALIRDPKVLILDEATSALDEKNQAMVQSALDNAMEGRTSIVIAHRLSTIQNCDWIFVMHNGTVIEQGTYQELERDANSYFFKLKSGHEIQ